MPVKFEPRATRKLFVILAGQCENTGLAQGWARLVVAFVCGEFSKEEVEQFWDATLAGRPGEIPVKGSFFHNKDVCVTKVGYTIPPPAVQACPAQLRHLLRNYGRPMFIDKSTFNVEWWSLEIWNTKGNKGQPVAVAREFLCFLCGVPHMRLPSQASFTMQARDRNAGIEVKMQPEVCGECHQRAVDKDPAKIMECLTRLRKLTTLRQLLSFLDIFVSLECGSPRNLTFWAKFDPK